MKALLIILSSLIYLTSQAQKAETDTLMLYNAYCESSNPYAIDTTIFNYRNDTLYIRNVHSGICIANNYRALTKKESDTLKIEIVNIYGADCLGDCSMGYTIKVPMLSFDTLNLKIQNDFFLVVKSEIVMSSGQKPLDDFKIFPNPVENNLRIIGEGIKKIEILDLNGNVLIREFNSLNYIDLIDLKKGIYLVSVYTNTYNLTKKILKE